MKYEKADCNYTLEELPMTKILLVVGNVRESLWVRQANGEVILMNAPLHFSPYNAWGLVLPSKGAPSETRRETIDITELRGEHPEDVVLKIHPECWDQMVENKYINENGDVIDEDILQQEKESLN